MRLYQCEGIYTYDYPFIDNIVIKLTFDYNFQYSMKVKEEKKNVKVKEERKM